MANQSLNFNELYKQSAPVKLVIALLVIVAILAVSYFALFSSQLEDLDMLQQKENTLKNELSKKTITAARLPILKQELVNLQKSFEVLLKQLPTQSEVPNLLQELNQAASSNALRISSLSPQREIPDGPVQILPYSITTQGTNEQLSKLAKDIGHLSRIVVLTNLNITANKDGELNLQAIANTYKASIDNAKK